MTSADLLPGSYLISTLHGVELWWGPDDYGGALRIVSFRPDGSEGTHGWQPHGKYEDAKGSQAWAKWFNGHHPELNLEQSQEIIDYIRTWLKLQS